MKKHSDRYYKVKEELSKDKRMIPQTALSLLKSLNRESSKTLKVSITLRRVKQKFNFPNENFALPFPFLKNNNVLLLSDHFSASELKNYSVMKHIFILKFRQLQEKIFEKALLEFGCLIAHSKLEKELKNLEDFLSKKKLFPTKKNGFLTDEIDLSMKRFFSAFKPLKFDKDNNLHFVLGSTDFSLEELQNNYKTLYNKIISLRPNNWKGRFVSKITFSTAMGPGVKITF